MAGETLSFSILGDSASAARAFKDTASTAALAAKGAKLCADSLKAEIAAADAAAAANARLAAADKALAAAEAEVAKGAALSAAALAARKGGSSQVADLLDINVPRSQITNQLITLKRLIGQSGVSDLLGVNLTSSQLSNQLRKVAGLSATIPVSVAPDVSGLTALQARLAAAGGALGTLRENADTADATAKIAALQARVLALDAAAGKLTFGDAAGFAAADAQLAAVEAATEKLSAGQRGLALATAGAGGAFGLLAGHVQLFGGALTAVGIPAVLGAATGLHILLDAAIETAAVIVPAGIAFGAFGAAAVPALQGIYTQMQAVYTTSTALGTSIYPLTGGFTAMAQAVQPEVYTLFGEALVVAQHNTGILTTIAVQAGQALDTLGARAAVALTSGGFGTFLAEGPADLAKIGDIIANIFGTVGNLLRVMPGYAQVLLGALDAVTRGLEAVTGSPIGQWAAGAFLAFHGFVLWGGLAATAAVALGNGLVALGAKFGLASAGALAFDAVQFGAGIKVMLGMTANLGAALLGLDGEMTASAAAAGVLDGAMAALGAVNPLVWVGLAAAGLGFLAYNLFKTTTYTNAYATAAQAALENVPVSQLGIDLTRQQSAAMSDLAVTTRALASSGPSGGQAFAQFWADPAKAVKSYSAAQKEAVANYGDLLIRQSDDKALIATLAGDYQNYSAVLKAAGGNVSFLNDAGLTSNQILTANAGQLRQYEIEVQAAADAQQALGLGVGRSAAALKAQTNSYLTSTIPAMQKVITAEDQVISVITGGQAAFNDFQQSIQGTTAKFVSPSGLADAAKLAGGNLSGLGEQSLAFSNTLYSQSIPALQKTVDALELQGISTGDLTKVVATGVRGDPPVRREQHRSPFGDGRPDQQRARPRHRLPADPEQVGGEQQHVPGRVQQHRGDVRDQGGEPRGHPARAHHGDVQQRPPAVRSRHPGYEDVDGRGGQQRRPVRPG